MTFVKSTVNSVLVAGATAALVLVGYGLGLTSGSDERVELVPKYQIAAWGHLTPNGNRTTHGLYIIDTRTGQLWSKEDFFPVKYLGSVEQSETPPEQDQP